MARGKQNNPSNRKQDYLTPSEPSSPSKGNTGSHKTHEMQDVDIKSHLMILMEDFKKDMTNSLKEM